MAKKAAISVRVPDEMKTALERAAADDRRSLASMVEKILAEWLADSAGDTVPAKPRSAAPPAQEGIKIMKPIRFKKR